MSGGHPNDEEATAVAESLRGASEAAVNEPPHAAMPGARLGRYLVIEELGRGGMGVVLRAYDPKLQREVALKLLRTDTLDASAQARLVREARAMARLADPNVVAVYDVEIDDVASDRAGVVLVMEYVPGTTLRAWLKAATRSWRQIIASFTAAGRGLVAAHAEGLLHRDFKPDNVLVGNDGRIRVTDFGLARASASLSSGVAAPDDAAPPRPSADDSQRSDDGISIELTVAGVVIGTPPYMAPEQLSGGPLDARTDQYAFCIALWLALTGTWPFEGPGRDELLAAKLAGAPRWPSVIAVPRHVAQAVRRGLAPAPGDRWPDMHALLAELGRDPSRRQRRVLAVGVLALAGLAAWGWQRVRRERTLAACAEEGARIHEVWNDDRADEIAAAFETTAISYAADTWLRSRTRLDAYADEWQSARATVCERVELDATLTAELGAAARGCLDEHRNALAALLVQLSRPDATVVQRAATASASMPLVATCTDPSTLHQRAEPPPDPPLRDEVVALRSRLADAGAARATGRYDEALTGAESVLARANELGWAPLVAEAKLAVGNALEKLGRYEPAAAAQEEALLAAGAAGRDELALQAASALVFTVGIRLARHDQGLAWGRLAEMLAQRLGRADDLPVAGLLGNIGSVHSAGGEHAEAIALHGRALAIRERVLGPDHPEVAMSLNNLGTVHNARGEYAEAIELYRRALSIREHTLGPDHPQVASLLANLGTSLSQHGEHAEALACFQRAVSIFEKALGPEHPEFATALNNLGNVHFNLGHYDDALAMFERTLVLRERALGPAHPDIAMSLNNLGSVREIRGEYAEAIALHRRALAIREKALGVDHPGLATSLKNLGTAQYLSGDHAEAAASFERALAILRRSEASREEIADLEAWLKRARAD